MFLALAAALVLFTPQPPITSDFAKPQVFLSGFSGLKDAGNITRTGLPVLTQDADGEPVVNLMFREPLTGVCVIVQNVYLDGKPKETVVGRIQSQLGQLFEGSFSLYTKAEVAVAARAVVRAYTIVVYCGDGKGHGAYSSPYSAPVPIGPA